MAKLKKYKHINEDAVLDLPKLAERVQFGTESSDMTHYYEEQEKLKNELKKETMKERDREEDEGYYDQFEYMQEYIWPDKDTLKKGYKLQMMFGLEDEETGWYRGTVTKIIRLEEKCVMAEIKWNQKDIKAGEAIKSAEVLKKHLWNVSNQKAGGWRQNLLHLGRKSTS